VRRVCLVLGYDGTEFFGSQSQPGVRTVQDELERMLQRIAPGTGRTVFAGRTDRGVHAIGQVVSVDTTFRGDDVALRDALNAVGPEDIGVSDVATVDEAFHARYDAKWREYRYRIEIAPTPPVLERRYVWWRNGWIDSVLAGEAVTRFAGEHRFGTFAGSGRSQTEPPEALTRVVRESEWSLTRRDDGSERHEFRIVANGFLPGMVRNMVGAAVAVGRGERRAEWIDELLRANDRRRLGEAAPARGLVLWRVEYEGERGVRSGRSDIGEHREVTWRSRRTLQEKPISSDAGSSSMPTA
jgi:tRNA pseudouridine38-40 synthase